MFLCENTQLGVLECSDELIHTTPEYSMKYVGCIECGLGGPRPAFLYISSILWLQSLECRKRQAVNVLIFSTRAESGTNHCSRFTRRGKQFVRHYPVPSSFEGVERPGQCVMPVHACPKQRELTRVPSWSLCTLCIRSNHSRHPGKVQPVVSMQIQSAH